ncbi:unnamed protein product [Pedinophyceae sp. YPF-701]|nr:unnamed protein product [Pedinophyceae sp. YPF-701]
MALASCGKACAHVLPRQPKLYLGIFRAGGHRLHRRDVRGQEGLIACSSLANSAEAGAAAGPDSARSTRRERSSAPQASRGTVKRKVALHLAYLGTRYRGLQVSAPGPHTTTLTVEDHLLDALGRSGAISASNLEGGPGKVRWSRSSRTDKGVHSLCTVTSFKMELERDDAAQSPGEADPEGLRAAARINAHLPGDIRVLSVQRVTKTWSARPSCTRRRYEYFLPARLLLADAVPGAAAGDLASEAAAVARLRAAMARMEGAHPFHNFTKRRLYRPQATASKRAAADRLRARDARAEDASDLGPSIDEDDEGYGSDAEEEGPRVGADGVPLQCGQSSKGWEFDWLDRVRAADRVGRSHYRNVTRFRAEDPAALVAGGERCVRITIEGDSFMLHQIRHMVGTALAVARGVIRPEVLELALQEPARVTTPRAPPLTLVLTDARFKRFAVKRGGAGQQDAAQGAALLTGERLALRQGGAAAQEAFRDGPLAREINALLADPTWEDWARGLSWHVLPDAEVEELLARAQPWMEERARARGGGGGAEEARAGGGDRR